jgi:hypothetical protein
MGIEAELKQISTHTLELLKQDTYLLGSFFGSPKDVRISYFVITNYSGVQIAR